MATPLHVALLARCQSIPIPFNYIVRQARRTATARLTEQAILELVVKVQSVGSRVSE